MKKSIYFLLFGATCLGMGWMLVSGKDPVLVEVVKEAPADVAEVPVDEVKANTLEIAALTSKLAEDWTAEPRMVIHYNVQSFHSAGEWLLTQAEKLMRAQSKAGRDHPLFDRVSRLQTSAESAGRYWKEFNGTPLPSSEAQLKADYLELAQEARDVFDLAKLQ